MLLLARSHGEVPPWPWLSAAPARRRTVAREQCGVDDPARCLCVAQHKEYICDNSRYGYDIIMLYDDIYICYILLYHNIDII